MSRSGRSRSPRRRASDEDISVEVEMFIAENNIDETAGAAFRDQDPSVQRLCIDEGGVTGRNVSAILMGRIKRCKVRLEQTGMTPETVERFIEENGIDETAADVLREQVPEVQRAVVEEGTVTGRNASATMMGRIRRAKQASGGKGSKGAKGGYDAGYDAGYDGGWDGGYSAKGGWAPMQLAWSPALGPPMYDNGPGMAWGGPFGGKGGMGGKGGKGGKWDERQWMMAQVQEFCQYNGIDEKAGGNLMAQAPPVIQAVLAEGQITGRNPNAVLTSRIKRLIDSGNFRSPSPVSRFISENQLDSNAEHKLREQPEDIQKLAIEEGPLTGRNPSAVLSGRIRRILEGGGKGGGPSRSMHLARPRMAASAEQYGMQRGWEADGGAENDVLTQFITDNSLDQRAQQALYDQPPEVQQRVIEEGPLTGRNPSAVLSGRIRRILEGATPRGGDYSSKGAPSRPLLYGHRSSASTPQHNDLGWDQSEALEQFFLQNPVDQGASDALREAPPHIQSKVIEEGNLTGRNPSAILLSRIRRASR